MIWRGLYRHLRMKLSRPHKTSETFMDRTLHSILVELLLCSAAAMGLVVSYLPKGTCCRQCLVLVSMAAAVFPGVEADAVVVAIVEALALRAHALAGEGPLLLAAVLLGLFFPAQFAAA
jgi:hypothetical protein